MSIEVLLDRARSVGWQQAFFEYGREAALRGEMPQEDQRSADWRYLLRTPPNARALVIGCGFGAVPIALAEMGMEVWVVDSSLSRASLLDLRRREQRTPRLRIAAVARLDALPFVHREFDFVCLQPAEEPKTADELRLLLRTVGRLLKPGGQIYTGQRNRWSFQRVLRPWRRSGVGPLSPLGYRRLFRAEGFSEVLLYAPLPQHGGIPLFYVPVDNPSALAFFLNDVFPLFNTVSPEVRGRFGLEYAVARYGSIVVRRLGVARFARHFVPGVCIIATCAAAGQHAA
jgi:SAM-dependent methyltransferase